MQAMILAGGKGTRLHPVTKETPKPLLTVQNRKLLDYAHDLCWKHGIYEVWFSLGYDWHKIKTAYPNTPFIVDTNEKGVQTELGTGSWLNKLSKGQDLFINDFFVFNADNLFNADLFELKDKHKESDNLVTIIGVRVDDGSEYGSIIAEDGKVKMFEEKGGSVPSLISSGYYMFSPEIFEYVKELDIPATDPFSLERDLFPLLVKEGKLGVVESDRQWFDVGTFERWDTAIKEWNDIL